MVITKLREHYDGPGAKTRRVQEAKEQLKICHYKNEMTFSFEKYVMLLKECFDTLDEDEQPITERDKIDYLLDGIQNQSLASAISNISMSPDLQQDFISAANILSREVQHIFPLTSRKAKCTIAQVDTQGNDHRNVRGSIHESRGRGRGNPGRGHGRGLNGNQVGQREGQIMIIGVNVTNPNRNFTWNKWNKLRGNYDYIFKRRNLNPGQNNDRGGG